MKEMHVVQGMGIEQWGGLRKMFSQLREKGVHEFSAHLESIGDACHPRSWLFLSDSVFAVPNVFSKECKVAAVVVEMAELVEIASSS
jgi:hypothetical protein